MSKLILCIDFDGVIHSYEKGWQNGVIYGHVVPGFFEWVEKVKPFFHLYVYSSRSKQLQTQIPMRSWLTAQYTAYSKQNSLPETELPFVFTNEKPPAFITIDDRAVQFRGNWEAENLSVESLKNFKPWNAA